MENKTIIELYELGYIDQQGQVCEEMLEDVGYEDGEALGELYCRLAACGEESVLLLMEKELKESYCLLNNKQFTEMLFFIGEALEFNLSKEVKVMAACEEVIDCYLRYFLMGFSDTLLERYNHCRKCKVG